MNRTLAACLRTCLLLGAATLFVPACADEDAEDPTDETSDELRTPLPSRLMRRRARPAGMPEPWDQPDSTGWFEERGKCGPTAVANLLKLYWIDVSPRQADEAGVHWLIGTMGRQIQRYLQESHPELGCTLEHPINQATFLRSKLAGGRPVLVWFNTEGSLTSHWVTAVGLEGKGAEEKVVVMSWGRYYTIPMGALVDATRNVYGIRHPSIVCRDSTQLMAR